MPFRHTAAVAVLLVSAFALGGCGGQGTNTLERKGDMDRGNYDVTDRGLRGKVDVDEFKEFDVNGTMLVQTNVRNTTGQYQSVRYRWIWFSGERQVGETSSKILNLAPKSPELIEGTAPNGSVDGFRLELNRAQSRRG